MNQPDPEILSWADQWQDLLDEEEKLSAFLSYGDIKEEIVDE